MVADVIKLKNKVRAKGPVPGQAMPQLNLSFRVLNGVFLLDAIWHIWALATNHTDFTLVSKFFLGFTLALLLRIQLQKKIPMTVLIAILFCLAGDILLQPLDLNYADMSGDRPVHFLLGVICFCVAYGHLARYLMDLNPGWRADIRAQPWVCVLNVLITLVVLVWMTMHNQAPTWLLAVLWIYSPIVVGAATLATYLRGHVGFWPCLGLVAGANVIVISDTMIGLTAFTHVTMPWISNPVWILSTYIIGIFCVFNAVILIEKSALSAQNRE
jgi:YhhN family